MRLLLVFLLIFSNSSFGFQFQPFQASFSTKGEQSSRLFRLENKSDKPNAVEIKIMSREIDFNGKETRHPVDNDFVIYPSQLILEPNQIRSVRVRYIGEDSFNYEKSYRIIAEQLPVNFNEKNNKGGVVNFLVRYEGAIYVAPPSLEAKELILSKYQVISRNGNSYIELVFENKGDIHQNLRQLILSVKDDHGNEKLYETNDLKSIAGHVILAHSKRRFLIPFPLNLSKDKLKISFDYNPQ